jgi:hypothetical protein
LIQIERTFIVHRGCPIKHSRLAYTSDIHIDLEIFHASFATATPIDIEKREREREAGELVCRKARSKKQA